jgi:hypothetical protein
VEKWKIIKKSPNMTNLQPFKLDTLYLPLRALNEIMTDRAESISKVKKRAMQRFLFFPHNRNIIEKEPFKQNI